MTITFLELYNEVSGQPWSMYDSEAESDDDLESALKISINKALSYLWNLYPWSFRVTSTKIKTKSGTASYSMPDGLLTRKTISGVQKYGVKYDGSYLTYASDYELLDDEETGEPEQFYTEGDNIYFYPTPDNTYTINISYLLLPYGLDEDNNKIYELSSETDTINIPEKYEALFKNCLISLAMLYAIADESDENYSGYKNQYEDALNILLKYCNRSLTDKNIVW